MEETGHRIIVLCDGGTCEVPQEHKLGVLSTVQGLREDSLEEMAPRLQRETGIDQVKRPFQAKEKQGRKQSSIWNYKEYIRA